MPIPAHPHPAGTAPAYQPTQDRTIEEAATTEPTATNRPGPHPPRTHARPPEEAGEEAPRRCLALCRTARRAGAGLALTCLLVAVAASPAYAAGGGGTQTLQGLISNLTSWIVGILAGVATLFLTIGGLRYLTAGGDPGGVEKAKTALKSAAVGYALAVLAPLAVSILASIVGGH